jgi:Flp pilus assembly protein TadG
MTHSKHLQRDERGAALLEFAFVFGIFVFVLYGLIAFGMILSLKQSVTHAATEGARSAIGITNDPATPADERTDAAIAHVRSSLNWLGTSKLNATTIAVSYPATGSNPDQCPTTCIKVVVTYPYNAQPLVPAAPGLGLVTPSTLSSTAIVALS